MIELKDSKIKRKEFNVVYARVSSSDQKTTLDSQVNEIKEDCRKKNITIHKIVTEIGSGLNGKRVKFNRLLQEPKVTNIIATHRDRLSRFGFEYIRSSLACSHKKLTLVDNNNEIESDLVKDIVDFMTSVCAKLYSRRRLVRRWKTANLVSM